MQCVIRLYCIRDVLSPPLRVEHTNIMVYVSIRDQIKQINENRLIHYISTLDYVEYEVTDLIHIRFMLISIIANITTVRVTKGQGN